jgi:hypothetical protein
MTFLHEVPGSKRIAICVATGKALVGHIEESKMLLLLDDIADPEPLLLCGIHTCWVMGAGMEDDDALSRGSPEVLEEAFEVQPNGPFIVVAVLLNLKTRILEDGIVVCPARCRDVDLFAVRVEALKEGSAYPQGTGAGNRLSNSKTVLLDGGGVGPIGQFRSCFDEGWHSSDASILLVKTRRNNLVLCGSDGGENVWLTLVVTCKKTTRI